MRSRITIEVDFDNGNDPVIKIECNKDSSDVRDKLLKQFIENFQHQSNWATIAFSYVPNYPDIILGIIRPVRSNELHEEAKEMQRRLLAPDNS